MTAAPVTSEKNDGTPPTTRHIQRRAAAAPYLLAMIVMHEMPLAPGCM
jgi:hypothetical protein